MKKFSIFLGIAAAFLFFQDKASAVVVFGLTESDKLIKFNSNKPDTLVGGSLTITGLKANEKMTAIDFRPSNNQLYGLGVVNNTGTVYQVDINTGAATSVITGFSLSGTEFGLDFNPVPDALRIVSNTGENLRIASNLTVVNTDSPLNPGNPNVVAAAYTNNFAGATTTSLYVIDTSDPNADMLKTQGSLEANPVSPNTGTLFDVGTLVANQNADEMSGFDITKDNEAFASLNIPGTPDDLSTLYSVNLSTGNATEIGMIAAGESLQGMAVAVPVPPTVLGSVLAMGFGALLKRKKKTNNLP